VTLFMIVVIAHWLEHIVQLGQVVSGVHRACASGLLGSFFPSLVRNEGLHYGYAVVMLVGLGLLRNRFRFPDFYYDWLVTYVSAPGYTAWMLAFYIQCWHLFEHSLLFLQVNLFNEPNPISLLQWSLPAMRIELHLFYNTLVTIPMLVALVQRAYARRTTFAFY
jgi:hypothetical protein